MNYKLPADLIAEYQGAQPDWGQLGEVSFIRTYSRVKDDGTKETWFDTCKRVVEGTLNQYIKHMEDHQLPVSYKLVGDYGRALFTRMFHFEWSPPGRGIFAMGSSATEGGSAALQNCAFVSSADWDNVPSEPFTFLMEASMLGIGVGISSKMSEQGIEVHAPLDAVAEYAIPDTREGWAQATGMLIDSYLMSGMPTMEFDYSLIRPRGARIKTFGGVASGPEPLIKAHDTLRRVLDDRVGDKVDSVLVCDIANIIGVAVVSGNVRRSAEIFLSPSDDLAAPHLKNKNVFPERQEWGWMSNNSLYCVPGQTDYLPFIDAIASNGEPGLVWMWNAQSNGRINDEDEPNFNDIGVEGTNPCAEQFLESYEMCTLSEVYLPKCRTKEDFLMAVKCAALYAKVVTTMPTQFTKSNHVMAANRRIGVSVSGVTDFVDAMGESALMEWLDAGYELAKEFDVGISKHMGIRESVKVTTVKPSGTVSLLPGVSPGCHWTPGGEFYLRTIRFSADDPIVEVLREANYRIEDCAYSGPTTQVVYFPVRSGSQRSEAAVEVEEKYEIAQLLQEWWSDNGVSCTLSFHPDEKSKLLGIIKEAEHNLKAVSFLPMVEHGYVQAPYIPITEAQYFDAVSSISKVDWTSVYRNGVDATSERGCEGDACEIKAAPTVKASEYGSQ